MRLCIGILIGGAAIGGSAAFAQDAACREALEKWMFKPARRGGAPVPMRISVEMHFTVR